MKCNLYINKQKENIYNIYMFIGYVQINIYLFCGFTNVPNEMYKKDNDKDNDKDKDKDICTFKSLHLILYLLFLPQMILVFLVRFLVHIVVRFQVHILYAGVQ